MDGPEPRLRRRLTWALVFSAALGALNARYPVVVAEDFMYYYCAGRLSLAGESPYAVAPYQACVDWSLGKPNPNVSRTSASAYPPNALLLFRALARLPPLTAFALWSAALAGAVLGALWLLGACDDPLIGFLLFLWPGFVLSWVYRKMTVLLFAAALFALEALESGHETGAGALIGLLSFQPQWWAAGALFLAAQRRWRALLAATAFAAVLLGLMSAPDAGLSQWMESAAHHSGLPIQDGQGISFHLGGGVAVRVIAFLGLAALAALYGRKRGAREAFPAFFTLMLLAQPYSHASDALWAFPLFLKTARAKKRGLAIAAAAVILAAFLFTFYPPGDVAAARYQRMGSFITLAIALAACIMERINGKVASASEIAQVG